MVYAPIGFFLAAYIVFLLAKQITKEPTLDWVTCCLWIMGTATANLFVRFVAGPGLLHMDVPFPEILGVLASILALLVILWYQGMRPAHVWTIAGLYVGVRALLLMIVFVMRGVVR